MMILSNYVIILDDILSCALISRETFWYSNP